MREDWLRLVDSLLRPSRPLLEECRETALRLVADVTGARALAVTECQQRIEALRSRVFAAKDGIVSSEMTVLEREWLRLARGDRDGELMNIWARIAPAAWVDRKRWRDSPTVETAVLLASDRDGIELAERAFADKRIHWRPLGDDFDGMPLLVRGDAQPSGEAWGQTAGAMDRGIHDAVLARFPARPQLARAVGLAARANDRTYYDLWRAGYVMGAVDDVSVTLEFPPSE